MKRLLLLILTICPTAEAMAGSATIFWDFQANSSASGSGTINFNSYNATSISISVGANAYGASQQGGGRGYSGYAEAVIGSSVQRQSVPDGSDPMSVNASNSLTVTKAGDGNWYSGGVNFGGSVNVSAFCYVDGENAQGSALASCSITWIDAPPANRSPTISWNSTPGTVATGQNYTISAHGHDADGNLTQVNVWRNGADYAFAGGGNGFDGDSGNSTTDTGPRTVTYTAQAVDSNGAASATISQTVTVSGPANRAPTIAWNTTPGTVANGQSYSISAHGHDADGNLTQVNVWRNGADYAFAGGGNGFDGDSGNSSTDTGPRTVIYTALAVDSNGAASATISQTVTVSGPANQAPTIAWNTTPGTVANGQSYSISAHGHDADGNLTQVNVWRNGADYAFAGGGNGFDGDSGNSTTDTGPRTVTYTAQAVDSNGAASATISQTVTVSGPANQAPTIAWNTTPGTVANGQSYSISAHGHDADGNLTQVNVWRNGADYAIAGGGNGFDGDSGNSTTDTGPRTVTYTAQAVDSNGAASATISQIVTVSGPANQAPTIAWNTTPGTVANGQSYSISAHGHDADGNLTQVNVWRNGALYAFAGGGNGFDEDAGYPTSDAGPMTVSYTAQAVDSNGAISATISQTVTVSGPANRTPTIAWNATPGTVASGQAYTISAHGHDADGNLMQVNVWRNGAAFAFAGGGNGFDENSGNSTTDTGPQTITYTANAVDSNGAASGIISQSVTVSGPANLAPVASISGSTNLQVGETGSWNYGATDADANLSRLRFYASTNGSPPWSGASGGSASGTYSTSFPAAGSYTWIVEAEDSAGAGGSASITVAVVAPAVSGSIAVSPSSGTAPGGTTVSWTTANATWVSVDGVGLNSSAASGSQNVSGLATGTYTYTLMAQGAVGLIRRTATFTVNAPTQYAVTTAATPAGSGFVSGGGSYSAGSTAVLTATPDATHVFVGWSGGASGTANPVSVAVNGNMSVVANFALVSYALSTTASNGGSVTPGGSYPVGTVITISASADATHRFTGWSGDAGGAAGTIAVTMDRSKSVVANFTGKMPQTIAFAALGDRSTTTAPFALSANATSGLPVVFRILSGPATMGGGNVQITGPGAITLEANQGGDAFYLPAPPVAQTFNAMVAPAILKFRTEARTLLQNNETRTAPLVLENP